MLLPYTFTQKSLNLFFALPKRAPAAAKLPSLTKRQLFLLSPVSTMGQLCLGQLASYLVVHSEKLKPFLRSSKKSSGSGQAAVSLYFQMRAAAPSQAALYNRHEKGGRVLYLMANTLPYTLPTFSQVLLRKRSWQLEKSCLSMAFLGI